MTQAGRVWYVDLDPSPKDLKNPKTHKKDKKRHPRFYGSVCASQLGKAGKSALRNAAQNKKIAPFAYMRVCSYIAAIFQSAGRVCACVASLSSLASLFSHPLAPFEWLPAPA